MIWTITYFVRFRLIKVMPLLTLKEIAGRLNFIISDELIFKNVYLRKVRGIRNS